MEKENELKVAGELWMEKENELKVEILFQNLPSPTALLKPNLFFTPQLANIRGNVVAIDCSWEIDNLKYFCDFIIGARKSLIHVLTFILLILLITFSWLYRYSTSREVHIM